jgi:hypothetical protein
MQLSRHGKLVTYKDNNIPSTLQIVPSVPEKTYIDCLVKVKMKVLENKNTVAVLIILDVFKQIGSGSCLVWMLLRQACGSTLYNQPVLKIPFVDRNIWRFFTDAEEITDKPVLLMSENEQSGITGVVVVLDFRYDVHIVVFVRFLPACGFLDLVH